MPTYATPKIRRAVDDHHIGYRTASKLPATYDLNWNPPAGCDTGCWRFDKHSNKHIISIGKYAFDAIADKGMTRGVSELYKQVYEHEAAHSVYTTPDLAMLAEALKKEGIPWRLQNLFEDIRIERLWWVWFRNKKHWRWTRWSKIPTTPQPADLSPTQLLYRLKCEPIGRTLPKSGSPLRSHPHFHKIWKYYCRIISFASRKSTTFDLIPILKDWLKDFPETGDDTIAAEGGLGTGDLKSAIEEAGGSVTEVEAPGGSGGAAPSTQGPVHDPSHGVGSNGPSDAPADSMIPDEPARALRLSRLLATAFKATGIGTGATSNPSKRINVRGLLRGNWSRPFLGRAHSDDAKPHVSLIFDLSGSMGSQMAYTDRGQLHMCRAADAGRVLVRALSLLASRGFITGKVYASGHGGVQNQWELPVKSRNAFLTLKGEQGDDGIIEALSPTPTAGTNSVFAEIAKKSKLAIVYTDGCFGSDRVNKSALHSKGVYTLGLCCTSRDRTDTLKEQFDHIISRESLEGLADALVRFLKGVRF